MIKIEELDNGFRAYGNKGAIWENKAHIAKSDLSGRTLCGVPMLSYNYATNYAIDEAVTEIGCKACISEYSKQTFQVHGTYTVSNSIGYEIEISRCGDSARARYKTYDDSYQMTDWCEIQYWEVPDENDSQAYITDCFGENLPLSQVIRVAERPNKRVEGQDE